jgi:septum formation protein
MPGPPLVLASASPRRRQLLAWLGVPYACDAAEVDETPRAGEDAIALVRRLARVKAAAVVARHASAWVLGCDTVVELGGMLLGKPVDHDEGARMLARLAGREHRVATGFALLAPGGAPHAEDVVVTRVTFRPLDAGAVARYVATGEADDKAGSYAIQGLGAGLIARIDGSFTNVVGLPLEEVGRALAGAGLRGG